MLYVHLTVKVYMIVW